MEISLQRKCDVNFCVAFASFASQHKKIAHQYVLMGRELKSRRKGPAYINNMGPTSNIVLIEYNNFG